MATATSIWFLLPATCLQRVPAILDGNADGSLSPSQFLSVPQAYAVAVGDVSTTHCPESRGWLISGLAVSRSVCCAQRATAPIFQSHFFLAGSNTGAEREASQGRVLCAA